jgi:hypothetical protein
MLLRACAAETLALADKLRLSPLTIASEFAL